MAATRFQWNNGDTIEKILFGAWRITNRKWTVRTVTDKVKQYEAVRVAMARTCEEEPTFFLLSFVLHHLVSCHHPKNWKLSANKRLHYERSNPPIFPSQIFDAIFISVHSSRQISNLVHGLKFAL